MKRKRIKRPPPISRQERVDRRIKKMLSELSDKDRQLQARYDALKEQPKAEVKKETKAPPLAGEYGRMVEKSWKRGRKI